MITSTKNQQVKYLQQLQKKSKVRYQEKKFIVEGLKMVMEAPKEWIDQIYVSEDFLKKANDTGKNYVKAMGETVEFVSNQVFQMISDTKTPQGILAVLHMPKDYNFSEKERMHLLLLENIQDPGNLGTMFRTGEGAGVDGIFMTRDTVDLFNPKTIRSTMGSIYRVPFRIVDTMKEAVEYCKRYNITCYAAHLKGKNYYDAYDYKKGCAFMIGNEGNGLTEEASNLADDYIKIPMEGSVESLNAAIAATILMYEVHRQRR